MEKLPTKEVEALPWDILLVDIIVPYKIRIEFHDDPLILKSLTIIYPATLWLEIVQYNEKQDAKIANLIEKTWLCRYPMPMIITYNRGNEFLVHELNIYIIETKYVTKSKCAIMVNPQANSILEIIHQVISNLVRTYDLKNNYLDEDDPLSEILSSTYFAVRITYHTMLKSTPGQIVLGSDMSLNTPLVADW